MTPINTRVGAVVQGSRDMCSEGERRVSRFGFGSCHAMFLGNAHFYQWFVHSYVYLYGSGSPNGNQWSFDMSFAQESFKNTLILKMLVSMDRALYIGVRWIFPFFPILMRKKRLK